MFQSSPSQHPSISNSVMRLIQTSIIGCCIAASQSVTAANFVIQVGDGANEGFNDPTPVSPVGGNPGTTLGQQRLNVFEVAADRWGQFIESDVDITVDANFENLNCSATSGILGSAGPTNVAYVNAEGARPNTFYSIALANALENTDLNGANPEIATRFNANIDNNNNCLRGVNWYYGVDGNAPPYTIDLLSVVMHEIGHGIGFLSLMSSNGVKFYGSDDIYSVQLRDAASGRDLHTMTDAERANAIRSQGNLVWTGVETNTAAADQGVTQGLNNNQVQMYAPGSYRGGSSVSHFDTALSPNELMEPFATEALEDPGLAIQLMYDLGWKSVSGPSNEAPTLDNIPANLDLQTNHAVAQVSFLVADADTAVSELTVTAESLDQDVIPDANLLIDSVDANGNATLSLTYNLNATGATNIRLEVSDGELTDEAVFQYKVSEPAEEPAGPAPEAPGEITPAVLTQFDNAARRYEAEYAEYESSAARLSQSSTEADRLYAAWGQALSDLAGTTAGTRLHSIALSVEAAAENRFVFAYNRQRGLIDQNNSDINAANSEASTLNQLITDFALDVTPISLLETTDQLPATPSEPSI